MRESVSPQVTVSYFASLPALTTPPARGPTRSGSAAHGRVLRHRRPIGRAIGSACLRPADRKPNSVPFRETERHNHVHEHRSDGPRADSDIL